MAMSVQKRLNYREMKDCLKGLIRSQRGLVEKSRELTVDSRSLKCYRPFIGEAEAVLMDAEARQGRW